MIKCIAIDDEPIALSIIADHCRRYGLMDLQCFTSPLEALDAINATHPEIVFLDIEMHSVNGIDMARRLPEGTAVIFTTAYAQYALDGFEVDAVDFLHKPIFYPRFRRAIEKTLKWMGGVDGDVSRATITLKVDHKNLVIDAADITHVEAMDNYVKVYRRGDRRVIVSQIPLKEVENMLPSGRFLRVHRSFIVAADAVEKFSARAVNLTGVAEPIPVGRTYAASLTDHFPRPMASGSGKDITPA